jgi:hypothetical protein
MLFCRLPHVHILIYKLNTDPTFLIRVLQLVLTIHNVDSASLGLHANSIIQWEHWVTAHLHLLLLICQLRPTWWVLQLALLPHHPHLQICGPNLFQDPARTPVQLGCQRAHPVDQLVQFFQRVDLLLIWMCNSQAGVLALQPPAAAAAQGPAPQSK